MNGKRGETERKNREERGRQKKEGKTNKEKRGRNIRGVSRGGLKKERQNGGNKVEKKENTKNSSDKRENEDRGGRQRAPKPFLCCLHLWSHMSRFAFSSALLYWHNKNIHLYFQTLFTQTPELLPVTHVVSCCCAY